MGLRQGVRMCKDPMMKFHVIVHTNKFLNARIVLYRVMLDNANHYAALFFCVRVRVCVRVCVSVLILVYCALKSYLKLHTSDTQKFSAVVDLYWQRR